MFPTVETRWFYRGAIPAAVTKWYHATERAPEIQPTRTDNYLQPEPPGSMGIKLREGRLEIKHRLRQYDVVCFHERACGAVEHWQKSSFQAEAGSSALMDLVKPGATWIAVRKSRKLRRYRVTDDGTPEAVAVVDYTERGCSIELAEIEVSGEHWWSLAFEAFGPEATLLENLLAVAQHAFVIARSAFADVPALDAQHSFGYAYWLTICHSEWSTAK